MYRFRQIQIPAHCSTHLRKGEPLGLMLYCCWRAPTAPGSLVEPKDKNMSIGQRGWYYPRMSFCSQAVCAYSGAFDAADTTGHEELEQCNGTVIPVDGGCWRFPPCWVFFLQPGRCIRLMKCRISRLFPPLTSILHRWIRKLNFSRVSRHRTWTSSFIRLP